MTKFDSTVIERDALQFALRKIKAEAEKAEVELETAKLVREYVREARRAADLPAFKLS